MGWYGSDLLDEAMSAHPCGCDLAERADQQADPRAAAVMRSDAAVFQRLWACPYAGHRGAPAPETGRTIAAVERLTGALPGEVVGCPGACVRREEAHEALSALRWWRNGQLHLRVPHPSAALVEAIDLIDTSVSAREGAEMRRARERAEHGRKN